MSDAKKCAACGATLPDGAVECGVCKERETWVTVDGHLRFLARETVGKLASLGIFGIGFLLIFSSEGLALHDLMAHSRVVRRKEAK
jgi:hypothetical protein